MGSLLMIEITQIKVEEIMNQTTLIENFRLAEPEVLLILKQGAELERKESEKGRKDRIDIMDMLIKTGINFKKYHSLLKKHNLQTYSKKLITIINYKLF